MALRVCLDCTAAYAVGLARCPHCGSERGEEQGRDPYRGGDMPKITRHGGATNAADEPTATVPEEGGEESSPGSSSETSTARQPSAPEPSKPSRPRRARTTGSRSGQGAAGSSTAGSADGPRPADQ